MADDEAGVTRIEASAVKVGDSIEAVGVWMTVTKIESVFEVKGTQGARLILFSTGDALYPYVSAPPSQRVNAKVAP